MYVRAALISVTAVLLPLVSLHAHSDGDSDNGVVTNVDEDFARDPFDEKDLKEPESSERVIIDLCTVRRISKRSATVSLTCSGKGRAQSYTIAETLFHRDSYEVVSVGATAVCVLKKKNKSTHYSIAQCNQCTRSVYKLCR